MKNIHPMTYESKRNTKETLHWIFLKDKDSRIDFGKTLTRTKVFVKQI